MCDTFDDIYLSLKHSLDNHNIFIPTVDEVKSFIGDGLLSLITKTLNVTESLFLKDKVIDDFMKYYKENCTASTLAFPGIENVLQEIYKNNIPMAIVSNKAEELCKIIIDDLGLSNYFKFIYGGDTFSEKKPSPIALINILDKLSISPENAFMIGDSDNDIVAGNKANMNTIYCAYGYAPIKKSQSKYIANSPLEILDYIK